MHSKKFWIWVDGQKRHYLHPVEPPGYTEEEVMIDQWMKAMKESKR